MHMRKALSSHPAASLYCHVPFCARKCAYCAFYSEPSGSELIDRYVAALVREMELVAPDIRPRTIFFGGGTPSLLTICQWERIVRAMDRLGFLGATEWTVECNPATFSLEKARTLRSFGVNRVSLGIQTLEPGLLKRLGRIHTREMALRSFATLRQAGFDNVNVDLMFAIPGQTRAHWQKTLADILALGSEHLSCYEVTYEEDTPLFHQLNDGQIHHDEQLACDMYADLVEQAAAAGCVQYEIANFARDQHPPPAPPRALPAFACRHNVNYWRGGAFYGLGPSATTYVRGVRTRNAANTRLYCDQLERGTRGFDSREELAPLARAGETAAFGLRMVAGWPFDEFIGVTGYDLRAEWALDMAEAVQRGWGRMEPDCFRLTPEGLRFADAAAQLFIR